MKLQTRWMIVVLVVSIAIVPTTSCTGYSPTDDSSSTDESQPQVTLTTQPPTATARMTVTLMPQLTATATPICPSDPSLWELGPYSLPDDDTVLYTVAPCVVEQIEGAFCEYLDARAERGRRWTAEDDAYFRSYDGFKTILGGEELPPIPAEAQDQAVMCLEVSKDDGTPMTCADYHVVLYTMSEGGLTADLLVISDEPGTIRIYDCDTGELTQETYAADVGILYQPMLYAAAANRWQVGYHYDVYDAVAPGEIDVQGMISLVLDAQGRNGPR